MTGDVKGMAFSEFEKKRYESILGKFVEARRPPAHIRDKLDISYRVEGQSVIIFEIRPLWNNPEEKIESMIAKATYVKTSNIWKVFWQRADLKWHRYDPKPQVKTIEDFLSVVGQDSHGCFFG